MSTAAHIPENHPHQTDPRAEGLEPVVAEGLEAVVEAQFRRSEAEVERFFAEHDELVARACLEMARRFHRGGRLLVHGEDAQRSDAEHVAVEFVHPVIVGKRALPAIALGSAVRSADRGGHPVERELRAIGRGDDILMVVTAAGSSGARLIDAAREMGMLTLALTDVRGGAEAADLVFQVADDDRLVAQEVLETLYHVLWELVHVFLERSDLLGVERAASGGAGAGGGEAGGASSGGGEAGRGGAGGSET